MLLTYAATGQFDMTEN